MRLMLLLAMILVWSAARAEPDSNLVTIPGSDPALAKAVAKARSELPAFLDKSRHPGTGMQAFGVKVGLGPTGTEEFFWLSPFTVAGNTLTGTIDNEPEVVRGYHKGQSITVPLSRVSDWMYMDNGKMRGNFTACVLLAHQGGKSAVAAFEKEYGADCSGFQ